jgi:hypothetical protein
MIRTEEIAKEKFPKAHSLRICRMTGNVRSVVPEKKCSSRLVDEHESGKIDLNLAHERYRRLWEPDFIEIFADFDLALLKVNQLTKGGQEWTGTYARSVGMSMIQNRVTRTMAWQPEQNGKMYRMIGNARYAALEKLTLRKSSPIGVT